MANLPETLTIAKYSDIGGYTPQIQGSLAQKMAEMGGVSPLDVLNAASRVNQR